LQAYAHAQVPLELLADDLCRSAPLGQILRVDQCQRWESAAARIAGLGQQRARVGRLARDEVLWWRSSHARLGRSWTAESRRKQAVGPLPEAMTGHTYDVIPVDRPGKRQGGGRTCGQSWPLAAGRQPA